MAKPDEFKPNRFWRLRLIRRAITYVLRHHAGVSVTVFGTMAALAAVLTGLGLYEVEHPAASPTENGLVRLGAALLILATVCSLVVLVVLVIGRYRDTKRRAYLVMRMLLAQAFRLRLDEEKPVPVDLIQQWQDGTRALLKEIDDTGGLVARYGNELGIQTEARFGSTEHRTWDHILQLRITRLAEFIAELDR